MTILGAADDPSCYSRLVNDWVCLDYVSDRRQEIVFIGTGLDEAALRAALEACLVGDGDGTEAVPPGLAW